MSYDQDPQFKNFVERVHRELVPKIEGSTIFVSITPDRPEKVDVKFAVELGLAIMMDKPIIATFRPGTKIPEKLAKVVDRFIELGDLSDPVSNKRISDEIRSFAQEIDDAKDSN